MDEKRTYQWPAIDMLVIVLSLTRSVLGSG